jgi:wyosine [tRNA(Phe)-imidazoG37] synthetase (radical SAM superfamily)
VYLGKPFNSIREKLGKNELPFPKICSECMSLALQYSFNPGYQLQKKLLTLQIEPSMYCQLECSGCIPQESRKTILEKKWCGHLTLEPLIVKKMLSDFSYGGVSIDLIDIQGHGEPLMNSRINDIIKISRSYYPKTKISLTTNANFVFNQDLAKSGLSEITFAIDGYDQNSYSAYRKNGSFDKAFKFMADFCIFCKKNNISIRSTWKYVLFDHNDSKEKLTEIQTTAHDIGINELKFIITNLGPKSRKILDKSQIPMASFRPEVTVVNYKYSFEQIESMINSIIDHWKNRNWVPLLDSTALLDTAVLRDYNAENDIPPADFHGQLLNVKQIVKDPLFREHGTISQRFEKLLDKIPEKLWE